MRAHGRIAALIPARAGSKGVPGKNLALVGGRSLLDHAVSLARSVPTIDRCIVSTDGADIATEAARLRAEVHDRPAELADDHALVIDTIRHVAEWHRRSGPTCERFVVLQPTSPLRCRGTVEACIEALDEGTDSVATFSPARLHPQRAFVLDGDVPRTYVDGAIPWFPRQELQPPAYELTGSVYAFWIDRLPPGSVSLLFGRARAVVTDEPMLDIDTAEDLAVADALLRSQVVASPQSSGEEHAE